MSHVYHVCLLLSRSSVVMCFFFNDTATTEIYTLSLHDALPIYIFHPPFIETQSLVFSAKCDTCHMALPLKIMHFRLSDHLCLKYCGAFRDANLNYFTHFI